jgi:thiosulfate dehydrogenase [quinone] large subunit
MPLAHGPIHEAHETHASAPAPQVDRPVDGPVLNLTTRRVFAVLRIGYGLTFLWAFFDKLLALGFSTGRAPNGSVDRFGDAAWIHGGSPTKGFLAFGADGPFTDFYHSIAGAVWADWLFMLGLLSIGLALTFGVGMRAAAVAGGLLYLLMWTVVLPPENNPVIDDHLLGLVTLAALALVNAGDTWGLGRRWSRKEIVQRQPALR